ncbi:MAG: hypothetical protein IT432_03575 [Phycisphaerales bacterium]|nr:hypothetical protein [Phycisphaerales bacterium]
MVRLHDKNLDGDSRDAGELFWQLSDAQFSSVAVIDQNAVLQERVSYTSYGAATHRWPHEVNNSGGVTTSGGTSDYGVIDGLAQANSGAGTAIDNTNYNVAADLNRDGVIDSGDTSLFTSMGGAKSALASGLISDPNGPDNVFGYDGYVYNADQGLYTVRFRWYSPTFGRWLERDPLGFFGSGAALYEYVSGMPVMYLDTYGLMIAPGGEDELDQLIKEMDAVGGSALGRTIGLNGKELKDRAKCYLDYMDCLAECIAENPDKLAHALAAAGYDVVKDYIKIADFLGQLAQTTIDVIEIDPNTGEIKYDWYEVGARAIDIMAEQSTETCKSYGRVQASFSSAIEGYLKNGASTPTDQTKLVEAMAKARAKSKAVSAAKRAAHLKLLSAGTKALGKANTAYQILKAVHAAIQDLKTQCAEKCDKPPCNSDEKPAN